jgi:hypothetical protein
VTVNQREFDATMLRLSGTYHNQPPTEQLRHELQRVLEDFPAVAVDRAVDSWVEGSEYFPKPAELLKLIDKGPRLAVASCGVCDGSGWIETSAPEYDADGQKAIGVEQPWVYKCKVCGGSGKGHG